jgi:carbon monoxide dehydrogenase subunit G
MRKVLFSVLLMSLASVALAHGPSRQKVTESVTIKAAPDKVWAKVKDFTKLHDWHPAIESSTATNGSKVDSVRTLNLKGGGKVIETLEGFSEEDKKFNYRMKDGGALPVSNYTSTMTVKAGEASGTTTVEWRGAFYRSYPNNNPPPEQNDEAAVKAITGVYQTGLANLKKSLEK